MSNVNESEQSKGKYTFVTLGCPKNLVDSERMLGLLQLDGYELVMDVDQADFAVVNTCGFIESAREESFQAIDEMIDLKKSGDLKGVIVSGCLAEKQKEDLLTERPEIDHLVGVFGREEVTKVADRLVGRLEEQRTVFQPAPSHPLPDTARWRVTPKHFAYLKISEGCNRTCTFCAIPQMRGKHATKPIEEVVSEAKELVSDGVRELVIVAQDTTYYGIDLYKEPKLVELLNQLEEIDGLDWIRIMYCYPIYFTDELIDTISQSKKIVPYIDMPLQHINDEMLSAMQRKVNREKTLDLLGRLKSKMPNLVIRSTFIAGFPGETEEQFEELEQFIIDQAFQRVGVFTYSYEESTPSAKLPNHISEEEKERRRERLMVAQQKIAFDYNESLVGKTLDVIIDSSIEGQNDAWIGRTQADAPDVDSIVYITAPNASIGDILPTEIVATHDYDLVGVAVGEPLKRGEFFKILPN